MAQLEKFVTDKNQKETGLLLIPPEYNGIGCWRVEFHQNAFTIPIWQVHFKAEPFYGIRKEKKNPKHYLVSEITLEGKQYKSSQLIAVVCNQEEEGKAKQVAEARAEQEARHHCGVLVRANDPKTPFLGELVLEKDEYMLKRYKPE